MSESGIAFPAADCTIVDVVPSLDNDAPGRVATLSSIRASDVTIPASRAALRQFEGIAPPTRPEGAAWALFLDFDGTLIDMWRALASTDDVRWEREKTATEIARDAFAGRDPIAQQTIAVFTGLLGSVAGDLALTLGARGGVYIAGGIVPGWGERFDARRFLGRFRAKGRFRAYLSAIPVHVVTHPFPGLTGVERMLEQAMADRARTGRGENAGRQATLSVSISICVIVGYRLETKL